MSLRTLQQSVTLEYQKRLVHSSEHAALLPIVLCPESSPEASTEPRTSIRCAQCEQAAKRHLQD